MDTTDRVNTTPAGERRRRLLLGLVFGLAVLAALACGFADTAGNLARYNAYWNCPTVTPLPTPSPRPTECVAYTGPTPGPGTPWPTPVCDDPDPTATPRNTATPYGRQILSQGRTASQNIFHRGQDVRWGDLRLTYQGKQPGAVLTNGLQVWLFTFDSRNEGGTTFDISWPDRLLVREVQRADGSALQQTWRTQTTDAYRAAGLPVWRDGDGHYAPGQQRTITHPILVAAGTPLAVGFSLDPGVTAGRTPQAGDRREGMDNEALLAWFIDADDPYCDGNTSGPAQPGDGGAVYGRPLPPTPEGSFSQFAGWPMPHSERRITQHFGCTDFPELRGYPCPDAAPYFHSGIDIGMERGTVLQSVVYGTVVFVGDSRNPGSRPCDCSQYQSGCPWMRGGVLRNEPPRYNLGWAIYIQTADGIYTVKYGHLIANSEAQFGIGVGSQVEPGQPIGLEGTSGCSSGPHLHLMFTNRHTGQFVDPLNFLGPNRAKRTGAP